MNVTMKDIAEKVGVTKATVSKALNNKGGVSEEIKKKILDCCEELGYQLNWSIQDLVRKSGSLRSRNIAFVMVKLDFADPAYVRLIDGIAAAVKENDLHLILVKLSGDERRVVDLPIILRDKRVDGMVISGELDVLTIDLLKKHGIPFVLLGNYSNEIAENNFAVEADLRIGINKIVEAVKNRNNSRIAYYDEVDENFGRICLSYLKVALEENDMHLSPDLIMYGSGKMTGAFKYFMDNLTTDQIPFDIIFCFDTRVARDLETVLLAMYGLEKCSKIMIVTARGYEYFNMILESVIMTFPLTEMAYNGTKLLCDIIENKASKTAIKIVVPSKVDFHTRDY